ncbi:MAG: VWA domain-containing protein [Planctomycetota bacterium]|nr:MAG: VWA domain-containing protein [Planctomycetota bacterium]
MGQGPATESLPKPKESPSMKLIRTLLVATTAALVSGGLASAQQTGGGTPPMGGGTGTGAPAPITSQPNADKDMDLPIAPAKITDPNAFTPPTPIEPDDDDGDDPRDTPPPTLYGEELDSENDTIFYVIDQSCSMGWDVQSYTTPDGRTASGPRMARAKAELTRSISGLSDNFKFNIIAFDCGSRQWSQDMKVADDGNKQSAIAWVNSLQPTGATGTGPATARALGDKDNMMVVLLTDGAPNCGASGMSGHRRVIRNANTQGATINVFGIAASGSYRAFCQGVASDAGGNYFDVP